MSFGRASQARGGPWAGPGREGRRGPGRAVGGAPGGRGDARRRPRFKLGPLAVELVSERMRDALNNNPLVQLGVVGALLLAVAVFLMSSGGGGEEESEPAGAGGTEATVHVAGTNATGTATGATPGEAVEGAVAAAGDSLASSLAGATGAAAGIAAPPLPKPVLRAWKANRTLVLLFVHDGGIDDRRVKVVTKGVAGFRDAKVFIVPAKRIARYAAITEGVGVDRVPALVVVTPKHLDRRSRPPRSATASRARRASPRP